jgi:hypothetical protein
MIDAELSFWGMPGGGFFDGWVEVPAAPAMGVVALLTGEPGHPPKPAVRAMPTRQLHITAGNAPEVPIISALRAILTKSAAVIKSPNGATMTGALFAMAAAAGAPDHHVTRNLSVVYWQGGDATVEDVLLRHGSFDRVVIWGVPEAVASVQSRTAFTRTVSFHPRYSVSLIGLEAFNGCLEEVASRAAADVMIDDQKSCAASLVHYIEGTEKQATVYGDVLSRALASWDELAKRPLVSSNTGRVERMRRGKYAGARWYINRRGDEFSSGVMVTIDGFDMLDHPMCRLVVVRPVERLEKALEYLHQGVSVAGVYPESRRLDLRDRVVARGVSSVLPLGQCERVFAGMPHDGMVVLNQLVDWKVA